MKIRLQQKKKDEKELPAEIRNNTKSKRLCASSQKMH